MKKKLINFIVYGFFYNIENIAGKKDFNEKIEIFKKENEKIKTFNKRIETYEILEDKLRLIETEKGSCVSINTTYAKLEGKSNSYGNNSIIINIINKSDLKPEEENKTLYKRNKKLQKENKELQKENEELKNYMGKIKNHIRKIRSYINKI